MENTVEKDPLTKNGAAVTAAIPHEIQLIPIGLVDESPTNPRKTFVGIEELAESIGPQGLLQPVTVRAKAGGRFELVMGARRFRACKLAKRAAVEAIVRPMTDAQVVDAQIVENLQRKDISELEEAEAYEAMTAPPRNLTGEQIAARVGKTKAYIYARLKLCALIPPAREALVKGRINASVGLVIARIPTKDLQKKALEDIVGGRNHDGDPMSFDRASELVRDRYMLRLEQATFPLADAMLRPSAGACGPCPKRTINAPELFAELQPLKSAKKGGSSADLCTDPECFNAKGATEWGRKADAHRAAGGRVLTPNETIEAFADSYGGTYLKHGGKYVDLEGYSNSGKRNRELLPKGFKPILARSGGKNYQLALASEVPKAKAQVDERLKAARAKDKAREAADRQVDARVVGALVTRAVMREPDVSFWRAVARTVAERDFYGMQSVAKRRGVDHEAFSDWLAETSLNELRGVVVELLATDDEVAREQFCNALKVDADKIAREPVTPVAKPAAKADPKATGKAAAAEGRSRNLAQLMTAVARHKGKSKPAPKKKGAKK